MKNRLSSKEINRLAIPGIISGITEPIISFTDQYFVGRLDHYSISAVAIATSTLFFIVWVFGAIQSSSSSLVARYVGEGNNDKVGVVAAKSVYISLLIGVGSALLVFSLAGLLFQVHNLSNNVYGLAVDYFRIRSLGIPFMIFTLTSFGLFRGYQNTRWALYITLLGGVLNFLFDWMLIERLGVAGAAWASVFTQFVMATVSVILLLKNMPFDYKLKNSKLVPTKRLVGMSLNMAIRLVVLNSTIILTQRVASGSGDSYLTAHSILMNLWLFTAFFVDGYANAGLALAGKLLGAQQQDAIKNLIGRILLINFVLMLVLGSFLLISFNYLSIIWPDITETVFSHITEVQYVFFAVVLIGVFSFTYDGLLIGLGMMRELRDTLLWSSGAVALPLLFLPKDYLSFISLWLLIAVWLFLRGFIPHLYLRAWYKKSQST